MKRPSPETPTLRRSNRVRRSRVSAHSPSPVSSAAPSSPSASEPEVHDDDDEDFQPINTQNRSPSPPSSPEPDSPLKPKPLSRRRARPAKVSSADDAVLPPASGPRVFPPATLPPLRAALLDWYAAHHRQLPWRTPPRHRPGGAPPTAFQPATAPDAPGAPYAVWVSEVMSQQTRLDVVVDYFTRWMAALPSVAALAAAPRDRVNELWAGLGYYRRARFLHEAAGQLVERHGGELPGTVAALRDVPGIGRYTAGAIASIAFNVRTPCVDGNVERVYSRLLPALTVDKDGKTARPDDIWRVAEEVVEGVPTPGDLNQALMELGATVCTPRNPSCGSCPVAEMCGARREALELDVDVPTHAMQYPVKKSKKAVKVREEAVVVLVLCSEADGKKRFLVVQRPGDGLLSGLWEAPNVVCGLKFSEDGDEKHVNQLVNRVRQISISRGEEKSSIEDFKESRVEHAGEVRHIFSHIRQQLRVKVLTVSGDGFRKKTSSAKGKVENTAASRWLTKEELEKAAVSTQMRKVFKVAMKNL